MDKALERFLLFNLFVILSYANPAGGDPRLERLFSSYMAPCCWQGNLLQHDSGKAEELRAEIRRMVAEGKPDEEIKSALVRQYSKRIMALPEGAQGRWLWWVPWVAAAAGLGVVAAVIQRLRRSDSAIPAAAAGAFEIDEDF